MKKITQLVVFLCKWTSISLLTIACTDTNHKAEENMYSYAIQNMEEIEAVENDDELVEAIEVATERKLIKTANITFETSDLAQTRKQIEAAVAEHQGYLANDNTETDDYGTETNFMVRIPSQNFDNFLNAATKGVSKFDTKDIRVKDVTEEFLDVSARLKTKKKLESRYLELLSKAKNVKEMLEIERELGTLRSDIEATEGRLNYLKNQVGFSSIRIRFYTKIASTVPTFGSKVSDRLSGGWQGFLSCTLGIIGLWPLWIVSGICIFILRKFLKRNTAKH